MSPAPFYTLTAGDLTVTAVSDGLMSAPLSLLSGISREEAEHLQRHSGLASPETIAIGAYLIRGRGNTVLVDTGTGGANGVGGRRNVLLVRRVLANCAAQISGVDDEEVIAGIRPCPLPGHTPGHTGYRLEAGDTSLLIWGDIVHFPSIQSARPEASVAFDVDPEQARRTREILLHQAASERWLIAGMHLGLPGFARVENTASGYCLRSV
ncbi:MBL fold metallo-hydrolase [Klebsiella pneumoniae]|uniref:MBL fold metallo-hydrolase n=1 Tax=Klebsiella pneumoniae TaxID=573 RepID=UPI001CDAF054|nr:MBL fold metallo-hydrolase [Klebsiella pneumoniae]